MNRTAPSASDHRRPPHLNKHVSAACDACRQKRRKCDGQTPCFACARTEESCVYSHQDRRRRRHEQNAGDDHLDPPPAVQRVTGRGGDDCEVSRLDPTTDAAPTEDAPHATVGGGTDDTVTQDHISIGCTTAAPQDGQRDVAVGSEAAPGRSNWRKLALSETAASHDIPAVQGQGRLMKDLQGKFATRGRNAGHAADAGTRRMAHPLLLPKDATKSRAASLHPQRDGLPGDQLPSQHLEWRLERRGYAVPGYTRTFGNLPLSSAIVTNGYPTAVQARQTLKFSTPEHLIFPLVDMDESPLTQAYLDFQCLGRRLIAEGVSPPEVADHGLIDVTLFFRDRLPDDPMTASTWTSEMLRSFRGTLADELLLACAVGVGYLMRWLLVPTRENYRRVPAMVRPTDLQRLKPHPAWVDLMVFPSFRNTLINGLRDWVEPCLRARWEILWPRPLEDAVIRDATSQHVYLTPEFADFVVDPKNWLMQRTILEDFPEIEGSEIHIAPE